MPSWIYFCVCSIYKFYVNKINSLLLVFISVLELIFINSLSDVSANIFLCISCLQTIYFVFSGPANIFFFNISNTSLQKNNALSLHITKIIRVKLIKFHSSSKDHIFSFLRVNKQFIFVRPMQKEQWACHLTLAIAGLLLRQPFCWKPFLEYV